LASPFVSKSRHTQYLLAEALIDVLISVRIRKFNVEFAAFIRNKGWLAPMCFRIWNLRTVRPRGHDQKAALSDVI
jgi:hypothetical protein